MIRSDSLLTKMAWDNRNSDRYVDKIKRKKSVYQKAGWIFYSIRQQLTNQPHLVVQSLPLAQPIPDPMFRVGISLAPKKRIRVPMLSFMRILCTRGKGCDDQHSRKGFSMG